MAPASLLFCILGKAPSPRELSAELTEGVKQTPSTASGPPPSEREASFPPYGGVILLKSEAQPRRRRGDPGGAISLSRFRKSGSRRFSGKQEVLGRFCGTVACLLGSAFEIVPPPPGNRA